jgi:hypothetical protein
VVIKRPKKFRPLKTLAKFLAVFVPAEVTAIAAAWGTGPAAGASVKDYVAASAPGLVAATVIAIINALKNRSEPGP